MHIGVGGTTSGTTVLVGTVTLGEGKNVYLVSLCFVLGGRTVDFGLSLLDAPCALMTAVTDDGTARGFISGYIVSIQFFLSSCINLVIREM